MSAARRLRISLKLTINLILRDSKAIENEGGTVRVVVEGGKGVLRGCLMTTHLKEMNLKSERVMSSSNASWSGYQHWDLACTSLQRSTRLQAKQISTTFAVIRNSNTRRKLQAGDQQDGEREPDEYMTPSPTRSQSTRSTFSLPAPYTICSVCIRGAFEDN